MNEGEAKYEKAEGKQPGTNGAENSRNYFYLHNEDAIKAWPIKPKPFTFHSSSVALNTWLEANMELREGWCGADLMFIPAPSTTLAI